MLRLREYWLKVEIGSLLHIKSAVGVAEAFKEKKGLIKERKSCGLGLGESMHLGDGLSGRSQERRWQRNSHRAGKKSGVKPVPRKGGPESRNWC